MRIAPTTCDPRSRSEDVIELNSRTFLSDSWEFLRLCDAFRDERVHSVNGTILEGTFGCPNDDLGTSFLLVLSGLKAEE